jgi:hypothetical protein
LSFFRLVNAVLSVLRFTDFDYLFGILKLFLTDCVDVANVRETFYNVKKLFTEVKGDTIKRFFVASFSGLSICDCYFGLL